MSDEETKPTLRSSEGLRNMLFDTLDELREGKISPLEAKARSDIAGEIVKVSKEELDTAIKLKKLGITDGSAAFLRNPVLQLGNDGEAVD